MPFLIHKLGESTYGIWLVIGALTSYFGLIELGVRSAIGRQVALYHSQGNQEAVNRTITGGLTILLAGGLLALLVLVLCEPLFYRFYDIPSDDRTQVGHAYLLAAANFVIVLVAATFDAALWGFQRFDWLNAIDIPVAILRVGLTFSLIGSSGDLALLATLTLATSTIAGVGKLILCFRANALLRLGASHLRRETLRQLFGYGSWNAISTVARLSRTQLGPILIGSILGLVFVPIFAVANRLVTAVGSAMAAVTGVLTPHATALHATNQLERQRRLFLIGGRHAIALSMFMITYLLVLGGPFIRLWVGHSFGAAITLLAILAIGEWLPYSQYVTQSIILATAKHRALAVFATLETIALCVLMWLLLPVLGLTGVGLAIAIPAFLARGVVPMVQGCRILGVSVRKYVVRTIVPPVLCVLPPAIAVQFLAEVYPPNNWVLFVGYSVAFALLFGVIYGCIATGRLVALRYPNTRAFQSLTPPAGESYSR
jgi:O-antigen/teichoic acid export membrane protein